MKSDFDQEWSDLKFGVRKSIRYHQRRRSFFDKWDQWGNFIGVVFGSAAVAAILDENQKGIAASAAAIVALVSAINLVFGTVQKARLHEDLSRRFLTIEKSFVLEPTDKLLRQLTEERLTIEADEPPALRILDCICHADQMRAEGYDVKDIPVFSRTQILSAHFFDWYLSSVKSPGAAEKEKQENSAREQH